MARTSPCDPVEAFGDFEFQAARGEQLHADADAEEGPALAVHGFFERGRHAGNGFEPALAIGVGADARQHDAVGGRAHRPRFALTMISAFAPDSRDARSNALAAEWRFPDP